MLSSSVDVPSPGGMSAVASRNVFRSSSISGAMYNLEKSPSSTGPDATGLAGNKKRRSSLGAKMVAIVGLSQWSKSTLQLNQQGGQALNTPAILLFSVRYACCFFHLCLLSLLQPEQFHAMVCHFWCVVFSHFISLSFTSSRRSCPYLTFKVSQVYQVLSVCQINCYYKTIGYLILH